MPCPFFAALRAAKTLKARALNNNPSHATVIPCERGCGNEMSNSSGELGSEESESELPNHELLRRGHKFLKKTRKGNDCFFICLNRLTFFEELA